GLAARLARAMAHPADGGRGVGQRKRKAWIPATSARTRARRASRFCAGVTMEKVRCGRYGSDGVACRHCEPAILAAAITAWVRLSTPSFCRIAETCALMVASETPSS